MAGWLERLFGPQDNEPLTMPSVGHPEMFGNKTPIGMNADVPKPVPTPKAKGMRIERPAAFSDPGLSVIPKSYTDMVSAGIDPESDAEEIGPGFVQGYDTDEEGDLDHMFRDPDPYTSGGDEMGGPVKLDNVDIPESPMAKMSQSSMIRNVDPEEGFVPGEDGVADAIHRAMQTHKNKTSGFNPKTAPDPMSDPSVDLQSAMAQQGINGLPEELEPLDQAPDLPTVTEQVQSQVPQLHKQNLFKALLSRMH